ACSCCSGLSKSRALGRAPAWGCCSRATSSCRALSGTARSLTSERSRRQSFTARRNKSRPRAEWSQQVDLHRGGVSLVLRGAPMPSPPADAFQINPIYGVLMRRIFGTGPVLLALLFFVQPAGAAAQLPPLPPTLPPPFPQPESPLTPLPSSSRAQAAVAYRINVGQSGTSADDSLIPPLRQRWSRNLHGLVSYPLIAAGRVFAAVPGKHAARVIALDRASGRARWSKQIAHSKYYADIVMAYGGGRLFAVSPSGYVAALDAATGDILWARVLSGRNLRYEDPPILAGSLLVVSSLPENSNSDAGRVRAIHTSDGTLAWEQGVTGLPASD